MNTDIPEDVMKAARDLYYRLFTIDDEANNPPADIKHDIDILARALMDERKRCAKVAKNGCLVPPDGGAPTEDERLMCERIAVSIMEGWKP